MKKKFPSYRQADFKDCGPSCLKIISKYYGKLLSIQALRDLSETTREGSSLYTLSDAAEQVGFRTLGVKIDLEKLCEVPLPCILHWNNNHFVVLYKVKKKRNGTYKLYVSDPAHGLLTYDKQTFLKFWIGQNADEHSQEGIALLVEPTPKFFNDEMNQEKENAKLGFKLLFPYVWRYKKFIIQLAIGLTAVSLLQLINPFLTQSVVDVGIQNQDLVYIYLILIAQLFIFFGRTALELIRSWILLHLSTRITISLVSDFFIKLMNLPISYFDVKLTGDIMQRISDHKRIEKIMTTSSLDVLFSFFNLFIFGGILAYYSLQIFTVFFIGSILYFVWVTLFLKRREALDYKRFSEVSQEQSKVMELVNGMQEIKLHNAEKQKRWQWEYIQARLFKVSMQGLVLEQTQGIGSRFINELKNIIIVFLSAKLVIDQSITLGMMMAITSIVGSLNGPVLQLIRFVRQAQDAKISLARLSEIHEKEDELSDNKNKVKQIPQGDIELKGVSFRYKGSDKNVLEDLNIRIPKNKITAIVGTSGSGKTTLMKLLLKFYSPEKGEIKLGNVSLESIDQKKWRDYVGTVMQEGFIFSDTIANNIAVGEDHIDFERLNYACKVANIETFIEGFPLHYNTVIGREGIGMSTGQKQRLLIARAVYKNPNMLFLDEATSALDANNEKTIMKNLNQFFQDKTVLVIAHRLSTVVNADQILVLENGKVIEKGTHDELVAKKGSYFKLVKNQLQLGQ